MRRGILYDPYQVLPETLMIKEISVTGTEAPQHMRKNRNCLGLIKWATNCDRNHQEKKNYSHRCFFFSSRWNVDGLAAPCCPGNMGTKSSTHQPPTPDFRVGVGLEIGVWGEYSPHGGSKKACSSFHSIHSLIHSLTQCFPGIVRSRGTHNEKDTRSVLVELILEG